MTGTDELVSKVTNFYNNLYKDCPDFSDDVKTSFLAKIIDEVKKSGIVEAAQATSEENAWYKTAVGYSMYVDKFCGTFDGLKELLDAKDSTLPEMGVSLLHLLPILDDGGADGGFDIKDYTRIRPSLFRDPGDKEGNTETFSAFLAAARERGMRVLFDVALNHCSVQHEWFETAVAAINAHVTEGTPLPADPAHPFNFFIWTTHGGPGYPTSPAYDEPNVRRIFSFEPSNWARVGETPYFYLHRFKTEQPDLNYHNPAVLLESVKIIAFWAHAGVGGLRLDALPYLWKVDRQKTHERDWVCENESGTHIIVQLWRAIADALRPADDALLLLCESNQEFEEVAKYLGKPGAPPECHAAYNFPALTRMWHALATQSPATLIDTWNEVAGLARPDATWVAMLRCHDELTLEKVAVTPQIRDDVTTVFLQDPSWKFRVTEDSEGREIVEGISARLASLLKNDRDWWTLAIAVQLSLPGIPMIYMGDEFGMGNSPVTPEAEVDSRYLCRASIDWGQVRSERADPDSWTAFCYGTLKQLIATRGNLTGRAELKQVGGHVLMVERGGSVCLMNYSDGEVSVEAKGKVLFAKNAEVGDGSVKLGRYGVCWLKK
ncbi:Alpha amylase, catalytic domain [Carpediemonas membranifera]|uniref:Alpha amylase, catalytic domain n=1 Tax=Carpediemonas membranifera TaxID=201153 RepID=A0A8J6B0Q2_9EUKA|nr:Alpha amylase, catalytic domain [Carpediemonas membranifera]|eukprot:KAG9390449.1 Alpha amylase, catalytic domain [Carpediemonas membranifera]